MPWFDISILMDSTRRMEREQKALQGDAQAATANPMKSLSDAANADPGVWRDFWRTMNLLQSPATLMETEFLERVMQVSGELAANGNATEARDAEQPPDRNGMLEALALAVT